MTETTDRPSVLFVCVHNAGRASVSVRPIRDEIRARVLTLLHELRIEPVELAV